MVITAIVLVLAALFIASAVWANRIMTRLERDRERGYRPMARHLAKNNPK